LKKTSLTNGRKNGMIVFLLIGVMLFFSAQNASYYMEKNIESVIENDSVVTKKPMAAIADADVQLIWNRTWGGLWYDAGNAIWNDGTYLYTLGLTESFGAGISDFALVKWDTDGNILWNRTWGGSNKDIGFSIWGDGTYIYTTGATGGTIFWEGDWDLTLVKWDTDGNILWNRTWGGSNVDYAMSIWGNGTYLYTFGTTVSFGAGGTWDFVLVKWDTDGNNIWNRTWGWGGYNYEWGWSIWGDETYLYTIGHTRDYGVGISKFVLVKWDTNGNTLWNRTWDGPGPNTNTDTRSSVWGDGTYLYTLGTTPDFGADIGNFSLTKWDTDGNALWNRTWGGSNIDTGQSIYGDGTYLYTLGTTASFGAGDRDFALVQWDTDGNVFWNRTWGGSGRDMAHSLWTDGTHFYALGETASFALGGDFYDLVLVKWGKDTINPIITAPNDISYEQSVTGNTITWDITDVNPGTYIIYKDSVEIESDTWTSGVPIIISVDGLSPGEYNYTIVVYDEFDNSAQDTVIVTVQDTANPVLSSPADIIYEEGTTGHNIAWNSADADPGIYVIYKNNLEIESDTWTSGVPITISVNGLSIGSYNYTIIVYDEFDNSAQDTVIVTAQDTANPILSSPADITYEEDTTGHNITWSNADTNPETYTIYKDNIEIYSGAWASGVPITINIDGLSIGSYNYTIIVYDEFDNFAQDTVIVTVQGQDTTAPFLNSPADITYEKGTTEHNIAWNSTDTNPETYAIYKDNIEIYSGAWTSGVPITISVDGLSPGEYNYTIVVYDEFDNSAQDTVIVTVTAAVTDGDAVNPLIISLAIIIPVASVGAVVAVIVIRKRKSKYY